MKTSAQPQNHLLAALPAVTFEQLETRMKRVDLAFGDLLCDAGAALEHVYFPLDSMVSLVAKDRGRDKLEVALIGCEGMLGCQLGLGVRTMPVKAVVQGGGSALRMPASAFVAELKSNGSLQHEVSRYAYVAMASAMQLALCNSAHQLEPRLARWLLMTRDRLGTPRFTATQQQLAQMLGARRASVNSAASHLQDRGLIRYSRGAIMILDAKALRASACPCYDLMRRLAA